MDNSWIKLYRKLDNNDLIKDPHALQVFIFLMLNASRETGEYTTGRILLAAQLGMKPSTAYAAVMRLQRRYNVITTKTNNKYTTIRLLNWDKYQSKPEGKSQQDDTPITTEQHSDDTNQEVKNKEERIEIGYIALTKNQLAKLEEEFPRIEVIKAYERFKLWQKANGHTFPNPLARFRLWLMDEKNLKKPTPTPVFIPNLPKDDELISAEKLEEFRQKRKGLLRT